MTGENSKSVEGFLNFMKRNGMNSTAQRRTIADLFFKLPGHHSLEEFYQIVSREDPSIGQTTVYRTLKLLCEAGFATEIHLTDDICRYEVADPTKHHDHLICTNCGKVLELCDPRIEKWQKDIAEEHGFVLNGHVHNLYGVCGECREKGAS